MTDAELEAAVTQAAAIERAIHRHVKTTTGAFEAVRGLAAYRGAVGLRKALDEWIATRALRARQE